MFGAFQTSREIFENPIWLNIVKFRLFFLIYGKAAFKDGVRVGSVVLKRGQWLRSIRNLQGDLEYIENNAVKRYSTSTIARAIKDLVKEERIIIETTEHGTLFTVANYEKYQGLDNYSCNSLVQQENNDRTAIEQPENSERTAIEQRSNKKKKDKKEKNAKNDEECKEVFEYYCRTFEGFYKRLTFTDKRKAHVNARLNEGYTVEQIKQAISNIRTSSYHCGENDKGMFYATLEFICRSPENLEKWINHVPKKTGNKNTNKALELYQKAKAEESGGENPVW